MKGVPVFLEGRKAETFRHCAISVNIDRLNSTNEQQSNSCYVIASDDLQLLCQGLCAQDAFVGNIFRTCEIKITIHRMFDDMLTKNPASASPQRRLLEPFTDLHSVRHFEIAGPANTEYCASIAAQVSRVAPTEEECFNKVLELSDRGYEKSSRNDLEGAVKFYKMAFCHLMSTCLLARTLRTNPTEFFPGRQRSLWDTYQTLQANLALVHYWLDEFEDAHYWARNATLSGPTGDKMGSEISYAKLFYFMARASVRLGRQPRATEELCKGLGVLTKKTYKDEQLVQGRREVMDAITGKDSGRLLNAMELDPLQA